MAIPIINNKAICILNRNTPQLVAVLLSVIGTFETYSPIFIFPDTPVANAKGEIDDQSEFAMSIEKGRDISIRIGNCIRRAGGCEYLILAGLESKHESYIGFIHEYNVIRVATYDDIEFLVEPLFENSKPILLVAENQLMQGLSISLSNGFKLKVNNHTDLIFPYRPNLLNLVIVEDVDNSGIVIAANYANSINAHLQVVNRFNETDIKLINNLILKWKEDKLNPDTESFNEISAIIYNRIDGIDFSSYRSITFFTEGIPYTLIYKSDTPACYVSLNNHPDRFVFDNIYFQSDRRTKAAIVFSPLEFGTDEETTTVAHNLSFGKYYVKNLIGKDATVYNIDMNISLFPFDIFHICSHGGEVEGYKREMDFTDRDGNKHNIVWDEVLSFSPTKREILIKVETKQIWRKFDGFEWKSAELKAQKYPRHVFVDMIHATQQNNDDKYNGVPVETVKDSCCIKCWDFNFQAMTHVIAGQQSAPLIFNNTCSSNGPIKDSILNSDIGAYIGTIWDVDNNNAKRAAESFYNNLFKGTLLSAFQFAINECKGTSDDNIYVFWGLHFTSFPKAPSSKDSELEVVDKLLTSYYQLKEKVEQLPDGLNREYHKRNMEWYHADIQENHKDIVPEVLKWKHQKLKNEGLL